MKYYFLLAFLSIVLIGCGCSSHKAADRTANKAPTASYEIDRRVRQSLGDTLTHQLFSTDTICAYLLAFNDSARFIKTTPYMRKGDAYYLSSTEKKALLNDFLDRETNYHNDSIVVMSPYIPAMEITFSQGNQQTSLIVSFSDRTWSIMNGGKQLFNYNYTDEKPLKEIYTSLKTR